MKEVYPSTDSSFWVARDQYDNIVIGSGDAELILFYANGPRTMKMAKRVVDFLNGKTYAA